MLILSRNIGSSIRIGGETVQVTVLQIDHNQVRLGITAPPEISVDREEIFLNKKKEGFYDKINQGELL